MLPDEDDQKLIHQMIYNIKMNEKLEKYLPILETLQAKYQVQNFISGCTEIHLLNKYLGSTINDKQDNTFLDPLTIIAQEIGNTSLIQEYTDLPHTIAAFLFFSRLFSPDFTEGVLQPIDKFN